MKRLEIQLPTAADATHENVVALLKELSPTGTSHSLDKSPRPRYDASPSGTNVNSADNFDRGDGDNDIQCSRSSENDEPPTNHIARHTANKMHNMGDHCIHNQTMDISLQSVPSAIPTDSSSPKQILTRNSPSLSLSGEGGPEPQNHNSNFLSPYHSVTNPGPQPHESASTIASQRETTKSNGDECFHSFSGSLTSENPQSHYDLNGSRKIQYSPLAAPVEVSVSQTVPGVLAEAGYIHDQSAYLSFLSASEPLFPPEGYFETMELSRLANEPINRDDMLEHSKQYPTRSIGDGTVFRTKMGVELKVDGAFDRENVSDDPLHFYHSRHYLEGVSNVNQLVDIRFVFAAHQLPRGAEFAQLLDPIRKRCMVDTYLIPHETTRVYEDQDVIFGISGTMDHVRQGIHDFLYITVPRAKMFTLWRQCLLVPRVIIHSLIGSREFSATDSTPTYPVESSVPMLKKAMARIYGPIRGAKQEHLLTIESCSFSTIMNAIGFVGNMLMEHSVSQDSCQGYYRGGRRSVIPEYMRISWDKDHAKTRMDARVPAGYVLRQEMHLNLKEMHKKRYHLQFIMDIAHAEFLAGEAGAMVRSRCDSLTTDICISDGILGLEGNEDRFRVCNVSGNDLKLVGTACKEIMFWMGNMLLGEWSMNIYIPHRVVLKASEWLCVVFQHSIHILAEAERQTRKYEPRLEPDEEESVVRIWSRNAEGFQNGILAVLEAIYVRNPNSIPTSDIQPSRNSGSE